jgi:prepilin-type N-terminal cleavage/methylation domain-containing protein/prepilin-type processing-associated H-X9-DG protein
MMQKQRAFTLVELLVVISIIAVLAGLIFSVIQRSHEEAASARCLNHLHEWGLALNLYANDNNGFYPRRGQGVQPVWQIDRPTDWFNALPPYFGELSYIDFFARGGRYKATSQSICVCPSSIDPGGVNYLPYAMNMYLSPWIRPNPHCRPELDNASSLAFLADGPGDYASAVPSREGYSVKAPHHGRANICFVDGHVESFDGKTIGCGKGDPNLNYPRWLTLTDGINQAPVP